ASGVPLFHRPRLAVGQHLGGLGLRQECAHFPARLPDFSANAMRPEDPEGIPVIPAYDGFNLCRCHESRLGSLNIMRTSIIAEYGRFCRADSQGRAAPAPGGLR